MTQNNEVLLMTIENNLCICPLCKGVMIQYMDTFLCPSCSPEQIDDLNWVRQHIEERKREGKQP